MAAYRPIEARKVSYSLFIYTLIKHHTYPVWVAQTVLQTLLLFLMWVHVYYGFIAHVLNRAFNTSMCVAVF